jgi:nickel/cobalt transporter (NicO) family protein
MTTSLAKRLGVAGFGWLVFAAAAQAQFKSRPFAVAGGEDGVGGEGIVGWLMAEQSRLTHLMAAKVHALHANPSAVWGLVALGLAYGVFHAAGPGHGKAVIASYMLANERSLIRGAGLALLAAVLKAAVAVSLVGAAAFIFNATASEMNQAAGLCSRAATAWLRSACGSHGGRAAP